MPGHSLHRGLELLVDAGLTPIEALRTATVNAAALLESSSDFGTVAEGKRADLVLLESDPLEDVTHLRAIVAVISRGEVVVGD